jgi:hypothetical protein
VNHVLYKDLGYDTLKDLSCVAMLGSLPSVLIVPPTSPANSVKDLVAMLKAKPGQYNYATAGVGSGAHVSIEKFNVAAGVKAVHVPLKGTPPILTETMGRPRRVRHGARGVRHGPVRDGKVKPLAVTTSKRVAGASQRADPRRGRLSGRRVDVLARAARAGEDAGRDRRQSQRRGRARVELPRRDGAAGEARHRADVDDAGRGRRIHPAANTKTWAT